MINAENPFIPRFKEKWEELKQVTSTSSNVIEIISKYIALIIVLLFLAILLPTVGVIISVHAVFKGMYKTTYEKLKSRNNQDDSVVFPLLIELSIYFILALPFFILLIPYWVIAKVAILASKNIIATIIFVILLITAFLFRAQISNVFNGILHKNIPLVEKMAPEDNLEQDD